MFASLLRGLMVLAAAVPLLVQAAPQTPEQVVQKTIDELLADLDANGERYRSDREAFYKALDGILTPVVDAEGVSRSIMTVRYSRDASPEQMARFVENFKRSLVQFYGNALLDFENHGLSITGSRVDGDRASVDMTLVGRQGETYPISYTLVLLDGQWRLRNVIVNGINMGKLFRDQFAEAMRKNGNDLDKTIDGWAGEVAKAKATAEETGDAR